MVGPRAKIRSGKKGSSGQESRFYSVRKADPDRVPFDVIPFSGNSLERTKKERKKEGSVSHYLKNSSPPCCPTTRTKRSS